MMAEAYHLSEYLLLGLPPPPTVSQNRNYKTYTERFRTLICFCRQVKSLGDIY